MSSLYYVTSIYVPKFGSPDHLRWLIEPEALYATGVLEPPRSDYEEIDHLMTLEVAQDLADYLQSEGHEAIALHEVNLPVSEDELASIIMLDGNLWDTSITKDDGTVFWAFTYDNV